MHSGAPSSLPVLPKLLGLRVVGVLELPLTPLLLPPPLLLPELLNLFSTALSIGLGSTFCAAKPA